MLRRRMFWLGIGVMIAFVAAAAATDGEQRVRLPTPAQKIEWRKKFIERIEQNEQFVRHSSKRSEPNANDRARALVDSFAFDRLDQMENAGLKQASLQTPPWSDTYWPTYSGILANRFADPDFPDSMDWQSNATYVRSKLGQLGDPALLSPAEKYDLLVGDNRFGLTMASLAEGEYYYNTYGTVEEWMGICHGWAPASFMLPRPLHSVSALAADGQTWLTFTPADIRGLATLLWANGRFETRFIGGRCNDKEPALDSSGRPILKQCLDNNPATWHFAVVNQIGHSKRSFVMDAAFDYEVWNQPVISYRYDYFNPKTGSSGPLSAAMISLANYPEDPYRTYRSPKATSVVGIRMVVTYGIENVPTPSLTSSPADDRVRSITYNYDLELSPDGRIVGGEWYSFGHPDFLWVPTPAAMPRTTGDDLLNSGGDSSLWDVKATVPPSWREAVARSSAASEPLARIVNQLVELSRK